MQNLFTTIIEDLLHGCFYLTFTKIKILTDEYFRSP